MSLMWHIVNDDSAHRVEVASVYQTPNNRPAPMVFPVVDYRVELIAGRWVAACCDGSDEIPVGVYTTASVARQACEDHAEKYKETA